MFEVIFPLIFFVSLFVFTVYSWMLGYHWFAYGSEVRSSRISFAIYLAGGAALLLVMGILLVV